MAELKFQAVDDLVNNIQCHVRYLRNARHPAMRLPPEILGAIFQMAQDHTIPPVNTAECSPIYRARPDPSTSPFGWLSVMRVCQYWHAVAVASPFLWNTITISSLGCHKRRKQVYPELFLRRSGNYPLDVRLTADIANEPAISLVLQHLPRIRRLFLSGRFSPEQEHLLSQPAPKLESLTVDAAFTRDEDSTLRPLPTLFSGDLSAFRTFTLKSCSAYPDIDCRKLQQLHIWGVNYTTLASFRPFLAVLAQCTNLEDLMFTTVHVYEGDGRRVRLPRLKRLVFDQVYGVEYILNSLQLPDGVHLSVLSDFTPERLFPSDRSGLGDLGELTKLRLRFSPRSPSHIIALGKTSSLDVELWRSSNEHPGDSDLLRKLSGMIDDVEELWVEGRSPEPIDERVFVALLEGASSLRKAVLKIEDGAAAAVLLKALAPPLEGSCYAPRLRELDVYDPNDDAIETLEEVLRARAGRGRPITKLRVGRAGDASSLAAHQQWQDATRSRLQSLVRDFQFTEGDPPASIELPSATTTRGDGRSSWPVWGVSSA